MENPTTPKRFRLPSVWIGAIEVFNAVLLTLTGYSIGKGDGLFAIILGALYAGGKNFVDRCVPTDAINTTTVSSPELPKPIDNHVDIPAHQST